MLPEHWTCSYLPVGNGRSDEVLDRLLQQRPTLVAISALTASVVEAYQFSSRLRAAGIQTVIGGLHVTTCRAEAHSFCNAVAVGDGEPIWRCILSDAERGALQPVYQSPLDQPIADWPTPRFDLLGENVARYTVQTQRGCPWACEFCAASRMLGPLREKPLAKVQHELSLLNGNGERPIVELADDNSFAGHRDHHAFCDALAASGARWFTESDWRIGERPDLLRHLAASGCVQILVGIESLVFRYPGMGAKRAELDRIMRAVCNIQAAGVAVNGCFVIGADGETRASIDRLVEFVLASDLTDVQLTLQTPFPGTALRNRLLDQGRILANRDWNYYTLLDLTFQPDRMTAPELEQAFADAIRRVYSADATNRRNNIRRDIWRRNSIFCRQTMGN